MLGGMADVTYAIQVQAPVALQRTQCSTRDVQEAVRVESYKRSQAGHNAPSSDDSGRWQQPLPRTAVNAYRSGAESLYNSATPGGYYHSRLCSVGKSGHSTGHADAQLRHARDSSSAIQSSGRSLRGHSPVNSSQSQSGHVSSLMQQQAAQQNARAQAAGISASGNGIRSLPAFSRSVAGHPRHISNSGVTSDQQPQLRPTPTASLTEHRSSLPGASARSQHPTQTSSHGSGTAAVSHRSQIVATHESTAQYQSSATGSSRPISSSSRGLRQGRSSSISRPVQSSSASQSLRLDQSGSVTSRTAHHDSSHRALSRSAQRHDHGCMATTTSSSSAMSTMSIGSTMSNTAAGMSAHRSTMHTADMARLDSHRGLCDASGSAAMETLSESSSSSRLLLQQQQRAARQRQDSAQLTRQHSHLSPQLQRSSSSVQYPSAQTALPLPVPPQGALHRLKDNIGKVPDLREATRLAHGVVGLRNLGNTCFMNSMLQCLLAVPDLLRFVLSRGVIQAQNASVTREYKNLVRILAESKSKDAIAPTAFLERMRCVNSKWGARAQQDSHEFLLALLDRLQSEGDRNNHKPKYRELVGKGSVAEQAAMAAAYAREWSDSWVDDAFGGLMQSTVECRRCGDQSFRFDTCLDVSVPLPSAHECKAKYGSQGVPLEHCLWKFIEPEILDVEYKCEGCGHVTGRKKWLQLFTPPRTLVLHLNRFSQGGISDGFGGSPFTGMRKNSAAVNVPQTLDMTPICSQLGLTAARDVMGATAQYKLIAVSDHSGTMGGGHYTATALCAWKKAWYGFNDSHVSGPYDEGPYGPSSSAYVLFFKMIRTREPRTHRRNE